MAYNVEKLHTMENALRTTAELIGENASTPNQDGVKVGLGLTNEAQICNNAADAVKEGVFKTIVMGTFKNGKSTIINSLIGSKVLPEAVTPATAIISYLRYGTNDNKIYVYKDDGTVKEMSHQEFFNEYKFTDEDADEAKRTGTVKRFSDVDYSVVYCNMPILENGVQVLDSPGLEDKECATKVTLKAASNANAIIYTGTVVSGGFNMNDKEFFKSNFEGRQLNNVFFLINKSDLFEAEELEAVKKYYKTQLKDVFVDEKGVFNEELYAKRVFFISARNVLKKKTGEENYNKRDIPAFERFEKELEEFLTTDARSIATFNSCFTKIANAYKASIHTADLNKSVCENGVDSVKEELAIVEQKLGQMENELSILKTSFDVAKTKTEGVIQRQLNCIVGKIDESWDAEINEIVESSGFGVKDLLAIAYHTVRYFNNEERKNEAFEERIKPITDGVMNFVQRKCDEALSDIKVLTQPILDELKKEIDLREDSLNSLFKDIYKTFNVDGETTVERGKVSPIKLLLSGLNNDVNVLVQVMAGQDMGWMDFLKRTIIEMVVDSILFSVIGGPIGFALFMLKEWWALRNGRTTFITGAAQQTKAQLIAKLQMKISGEESDEIYTKIRKTFDEAFADMSCGVNSKIADERQLLADTQRKLDDVSYNYEAEIERCEYITDKIWETARDAYKSVFEKTIALDEFTQLSVQ